MNIKPSPQQSPMNKTMTIDLFEQRIQEEFKDSFDAILEMDSITELARQNMVLKQKLKQEELYSLQKDLTI